MSICTSLERLALLLILLGLNTPDVFLLEYPRGDKGFFLTLEEVNRLLLWGLSDLNLSNGTVRIKVKSGEESGLTIIGCCG